MPRVQSGRLGSFAIIQARDDGGLPQGADKERVAHTGIFLTKKVYF